MNRPPTPRCERFRRRRASSSGPRTADLGQPIWERIAEFTFEGEFFRQHEVWFLARVDVGAERESAMTEQERRSTLGSRWWMPEELSATSDVIVPADLGSRLARLRARPR